MKTNLDHLFKTNKNAETDGVIFKLSDTVNFIVRRYGGANEQKVKAAMAKYYKPYARQVEAGTLPASKEREILVKAFVSACMVGWEGLEADGTKLEYTPENAEKLFTDMPDLFNTIFDYAQTLSTFREDVGNS